MTPDAFIAKWRASELKERSAAQEHFIDLCRLLGEPTPAEADPRGEWYSFERGATKTAGGAGWADVWKRGHFAWEYKGKDKDLGAAFSQLQQYALALENPPLLVVCDTGRFEVRTNWTNSVSQVHVLALDDLRDASKLRILKWILSDPEKLRPSKTRQALTEEAAGGFARLALALRGRGHDPQRVAHFVKPILPDAQLMVTLRDDGCTFGILHSRFHELWSLRMGTWLGKGNDPRYTPSTTFETFPFPDGLTPNLPASSYASEASAVAIAAAAKRLDDLRQAWLNPSDLVRREPEVVPGYPDRLLPVDDKAAVILKKRTLTNLYNERPTWLNHAHQELDAAVAAAYGWPDELSHDDALERLYALNRSRVS